MARIKYYYDTETCSYEKATFTWKKAILTVSGYLLVSSVLAGIMIAGMFYFIDNPEEKRLKKKINQLTEKIDEYNTKLVAIESEVDSLHARDNDVYRTILNADRITTTMWEMGTGGTDKYSKLEPNSLKETEKRIDRLMNRIELQTESYNQIYKDIVANEDRLQHKPSIRPVDGLFISGFGRRMHPILKVWKKHTGIDFRAPIGTPIYATADATVEFCGVSRNGYGKHIDLNHGYGYATKYAHLSKISVKKGDKVKRGDLIGYTGNTGLSKGPHLHYELSHNGQKINPVDHFYSDLTPEEYMQLKALAEQENESMD